MVSLSKKGSVLSYDEFIELNDTPSSYSGAGLDLLRVNTGATAIEFVDLSSISHTSLADIGINTHTQIDTHIGSTSNPHSVTYSQVGAIQDTIDIIKDTHIDWGTGANQVSTTDMPEGTNLYYTDARARTSISTTATGLTYTSGTGVLSLTAGYVIPTTTEETNWNTAYTSRVSTWTLPLSFSSNTVTLNRSSTDFMLSPAVYQGTANTLSILDSGIIHNRTAGLQGGEDEVGVWTDDFEDADISDWTLGSTAPDFPTVSTDVAHGGTYSVKLPAPTSMSFLWKPEFLDATKKVRYSVWVYPTNVYNRFLIFTLYKNPITSQETGKSRIWLTAGGNIRNGTSGAIIGTYTANNWIKLEIRENGDETADIYVNDIRILKDDPWFGSTGGAPNSFSIENLWDGNIVYVDDVRISYEGDFYHLKEAEHTELTAWLDDVTLSDGGSLDLGTGTLTATTITDGTASMTSGALSGLTSVTATTLTDGTLSITGGNLTTTGTITGGVNSQFGTATQYWNLEFLDLGAYGQYPMWIGYSDGALGNYGGFKNILCVDMSGVTYPSLMFIGAGLTNAQIYFEGGYLCLTNELIPATDNDISLGNVSNRWSDLFIGNSLSDGSNYLYISNLITLTDTSNCDTLHTHADFGAITVLSATDGTATISAGEITSINSINRQIECFEYGTGVSIRNNGYWDAWTEQADCSFVEAGGWGHLIDANETARITPTYTFGTAHTWTATTDFFEYTIKLISSTATGYPVLQLRSAAEGYISIYHYSAAQKIRIVSDATNTDAFTGLTPGDEWRVKCIYVDDEHFNAFLSVNGGEWEASSANPFTIYQKTATGTKFSNGDVTKVYILTDVGAGTGTSECYLDNIITSWETDNISTFYTNGTGYLKSDGDINVKSAGDIILTPTGNVQFGTYAAITTETLQGFITIKDSDGNTRKVAVVA